MPSKLALKKGQKEGKNEGFKSVTVKKEEMAKAMTKRSPSPKRKREPPREVIILSDDSNSKMEVDKEIGEEEEVLSVDSSEDDLVLKKVPTPKKKKRRGFVNFMADLDSDKEDEDMFSEENDLDDNKDRSKKTLSRWMRTPTIVMTLKSMKKRRQKVKRNPFGQKKKQNLL